MKCRICGEDIIKTEKITDLKSDVNRYYRHPTKINKGGSLFGWCNDCMFGQIDYLLDDDFYADYTMLHIDAVTKGTDRGVSTYYDVYYKNLLERLSELTDGGYLLDIGCGLGTLLGYAKEFFVKCKGVEPSRDAQETCQKKGLDIVCGYFDENWQDKGYSAITATQVLEHLENPISVVKTMYNTLEDGGFAYVDVPNGGRIYAESRYYDVYMEHINYWSVFALAKAFAASGFSVVEAKEIHDGNHIMLMAKKESGHIPLEERKSDDRGRLEKLLAGYENVAVWGCGVKGSVYVRGLKSDKIRHFFDSDERLNGLYIDDFDLPVSAPNAERINEIDLILITATEHKDAIERDLRQKYGYKGTVKTIDDI